MYISFFFAFLLVAALFCFCFVLQERFFLSFVCCILARVQIQSLRCDLGRFFLRRHRPRFELIRRKFPPFPLKIYLIWRLRAGLQSIPQVLSCRRRRPDRSRRVFKFCAAAKNANARVHKLSSIGKYRQILRLWTHSGVVSPKQSFCFEYFWGIEWDRRGWGHIFSFVNEKKDNLTGVWFDLRSRRIATVGAEAQIWCTSENKKCAERIGKFRTRLSGSSNLCTAVFETPIKNNWTEWKSFHDSRRIWLLTSDDDFPEGPPPRSHRLSTGHPNPGGH